MVACALIGPFVAWALTSAAFILAHGGLAGVPIEMGPLTMDVLIFAGAIGVMPGAIIGWLLGKRWDQQARPGAPSG